ncbi:MAG: hypothetical protein GY870_21985 [archaeon]|nr:hypothetical protein [archaeon]
MIQSSIIMKEFCEGLLADLNNITEDTKDFDISCVKGTLESRISICDKEIKFMKFMKEQLEGL